MKYMVKKALHFSHNDFLKAAKIDLQPLFGEVGIWALKQYAAKQKLKGNQDKLKAIRTAIDIAKNVMEFNFSYISIEKKYNFINKFGPKKMPDKVIARDSVKHIYSWVQYAPQEWLSYNKKVEDEIEQAINPSPSTKKCNLCHQPETAKIKMKVCSQC